MPLIARRPLAPGAAHPGRGATVLLMLRWPCALVVGGVVSTFAILLLTGRYKKEGPVVATVSADHGLHVGDVFVIAGWAAAMLALLWLVLMSGRAAPQRPEQRGRRP